MACQQMMTLEPLIRQASEMETPQPWSPFFVRQVKWRPDSREELPVNVGQQFGSLRLNRKGQGDSMGCNYNSTHVGAGPSGVPRGLGWEGEGRGSYPGGADCVPTIGW